MFVPLHDTNSLKVIRFQVVTGLIIALNLIAVIYTAVVVGGINSSTIAMSFGAVPALLTDFKVLPENLTFIPEAATLVTYMFLHAGWIHFLSNMAFMWVFADNIEDAFGHIGFLVFFLFCGVVAALAHTLSAPHSQSPLIGASGAVSGVMAAYLVLFPKARVWVLLFLKIPLPIPAFLALGGWIAFQFFQTTIAQPEKGVAVAWWAHIGGFFAGGLIAFLLRKWLSSRLENSALVPGNDN